MGMWRLLLDGFWNSALL